MKKLIKNGIIVTENTVTNGDLLIDGEEISALGNFKSSENLYDEVYDADGCYVFPGLIDPHTHMELQQSPKYRSVDDFFTGTKAAAVGGTTMIVDHIAFGPEGCSLHYSLDVYKELAVKSAIDYSFHGVLQHVDENILRELDEIITNEGIASFKAYSTYGFAMSDLDFYRILCQMKESGGILAVHCENDTMTKYLTQKNLESGHTAPKYHPLSRPAEAEAEAIDTVLNLAKLAGDAPVYIVHTSSKPGAKRIRLGRQMGQQNIFAETCTQYLTLTADKYQENGDIEGLKYIMAPPLRYKADIDELWKSLADGTIDTVATDHCPFYFETQKKDGMDNFSLAPGGTPGVEERPRIIFSEGVMKGLISLTDYAKIMSVNAAKIFGMYPKKGALIPGADADVTIIDPAVKQVLSVKNQAGNCDYNTYEGMTVGCGIRYVFSRGNLVCEYGKFTGQKGAGKFVYRKRDY